MRPLSLCTKGAYQPPSKHPKRPPNQISHYLPSQPPILSRFSPKTNLGYFHPQQSQTPLFSISTDTFISPKQLPNISYPVAITDFVGLSKSHCYLLPLFRDLIEPNIKGARQPLSSGATCSAGRAKKDWGRCWEGVVAMGVALGGGFCEEVLRSAGGWVIVGAFTLHYSSDVRRATQGFYGSCQS